MTLHLSRLRRRRNQLICESTHNYTNLLTHTHTQSRVSVFDLLLCICALTSLAPNPSVCALPRSLSVCLSLFLSFPLIVKTRQTSSFASGTRVEQTCLKPDL